MRPKGDLHESRLLSATDDDEASTTIPLTCYVNKKNMFNDVNETQKL